MRLAPLPLALLLLLAVPLSAHADTVDVDFPDGWTVTNRPLPATGGRPLPGTRHTAMKRTPTAVEAAIELTEMPQASGLDGKLPIVIEAALDEIRTGAKSHGMTLACGPVEPATVAGHTGLRAECTIDKDGTTVVRQRLLLWNTATALYSLTYTASPATYDANAPAFTETLESIRTD